MALAGIIKYINGFKTAIEKLYVVHRYRPLHGLERSAWPHGPPVPVLPEQVRPHMPHGDCESNITVYQLID